jgi:hypothetical protein
MPITEEQLDEWSRAAREATQETWWRSAAASPDVVLALVAEVQRLRNAGLEAMHWWSPSRRDEEAGEAELEAAQRLWTELSSVFARKG